MRNLIGIIVLGVFIVLVGFSMMGSGLAAFGYALRQWFFGTRSPRQSIELDVMARNYGRARW